MEDPAAVQGDEDTLRRAFTSAFTTLHRRIAIFLNLPLHKPDGLALQKELQDIGMAKG